MSTWLDSLRATAEKATKGPWEHHNWDQMEAPHVVAPSLWDGKSSCNGSFDVPRTFENAAHIARWDPATALLVVEALAQLDAAAALLEHGDFKNGVEHNGTDEGDVKAGYMLSDIKNAIYRLREHIEAEEKG